MALSRTSSLRALLREMRELCPTILPVRVRRRPLKSSWGETCLCYSPDGRPSHFYVVLDSRLPWPALVMILVHEWAHCVAWQEGETVCDHDTSFGVAYSRIWQDVIQP